MKKLKVVTVVGTRPEIIRLSLVIQKLNRYCEHYLIHTGQNYDYELNEIFFKELEIRKPDYFLNCADLSPAKTIGNTISKVDEVLERLSPDALLVLGDTNSCLSVLAAKRRKIPIFHMEAGNRCFDMRVPEEINRKIVDHTSDVNLTYSSIARDYLINEGIQKDLVIKTGSPMNEVISYYKKNIYKSEILQKIGLEKKQYFVFSIHREENISSENKVDQLIQIVNKLTETYRLPIIFSTHPRTREQIYKSKKNCSNLVQLLKPLGYYDYVHLQLNAKAVLSDSGTISEESSILNFPALNLREAHERPEAIEEASVMMVGFNIPRILQALNILEDQSKLKISILNRVRDYDDKNISDKIVRIIHSYTDYVNRVVWKKY